MLHSLELGAFLNDPSPLLDVRAPAEYARGRLPGAQNMPLFDDAERAEVGTLYHRQGYQRALLAALEIFGPKMADFVRRADQIAPHKRLRIYCWRGGQRSGSMAWLFDQAGFEVHLLKGGYKSYRRDCLALFARPWRIVLVGGMTGSGKTEVLQALARQGEQTLDLEALAGHRGSAFGGLGLPPQAGNEDFENRLADALRPLDPARALWLEDESANIGKLVLPLDLRRQMDQAPLIALDLPRALRLKRLIAVYAGFAPAELAACLEKLRRRLGSERMRDCLAALSEGRPELMIERVLEYYDSGYAHGLARRSHTLLPLELDEPEQAAQSLIRTYRAEEALQA